jgi:putative phosphoribosyl transferase
MKRRFRDRIEAGELLAGKLAEYAGRPDVLVLALPRGGVPVGFEVARRLNVPLDALVVRKLGVPGQEEFAMGAVASGGVLNLNARTVEALGIPAGAIDAVVARERSELERRETVYRGGRPAPDVRHRTVILVDDGIATGSTMRAAIGALRSLGARRIVAAAPVMAGSSFRDMRGDADEVVAVIAPEDFSGVGQWYEDFSQTTDGAVQALLASAARPRPAG